MTTSWPITDSSSPQTSVQNPVEKVLVELEAFAHLEDFAN